MSRPKLTILLTRDLAAPATTGRLIHGIQRVLDLRLVKSDSLLLVYSDRLDELEPALVFKSMLTVPYRNSYSEL